MKFALIILSTATIVVLVHSDPAMAEALKDESKSGDLDDSYVQGKDNQKGFEISDNDDGREGIARDHGGYNQGGYGHGGYGPGGYNQGGYGYGGYNQGGHGYNQGGHGHGGYNQGGYGYNQGGHGYGR